MNVIPSLLLLFVLIGVNAFFAASEIAVISVNPNRMKKLSEEGNRKAALLLTITDEPANFLSTIQVGVTLSGFLASTVAADNFAVYFDRWLSFLPVNKSLLHGIVLVILNIILAYFSLVLGEITPKRVAMKYPDQLALKVVGFIWGLYKVCRPFIRLVSASTNGILRLLHIDPEDEEEAVTEEEIRLMVEAGEETGTIASDEKDMIEHIFEFDDMRVSEHMTHRTEVCAVEAGVSLPDLLNVVTEEKYSRIPVYEETIDNILGIINDKDFFRAYVERSNFELKEILQDVLFVPPKKRISEMLKDFQKSKTQMAVVTDQFGGTLGIVTVEDIVEELVGEIWDEDEEIVTELAKEADGSYLVSGDMKVEDLYRELFPNKKFHEEDTRNVSGWVMEELDKIPETGEQFTDGPLQVIVREVEDQRVMKVQITILPDAIPKEEEDE